MPAAADCCQHKSWANNSHLWPVAIGGQPLPDLGDGLPPRLWILSAHEHGLVELQQSWNAHKQKEQKSEPQMREGVWSEMAQRARQEAGRAD